MTSDLDSRSRHDARTAAGPSIDPAVARVLVGFELDERGRQAVTWAARLADRLDVDIDLVCPLTNATTEHDLEEEATLESESAQEVRGWLGTHGVVADHILVAENDLDDALVGATRPGDVVVLGVHQHEGVTRWALGSRPHEMAHRLKCPLILVPPGVDASADAPILVGLDTSDTNRRVVEWSREVAASLWRPIEAVYARDPMYDTFDAAGDLGDDESAARLAAAMEDLPLHERADDAEHVLRAVAEERGAFLTVVGVTGHLSFGGHRLGTVVDHLIHTPPGPMAIVTHDAIAHITVHDRDISRGAAEVARGLRRLVVATDADGTGFARARAAARRLAQENGFEVILYDRSHEHWTESPHAGEPLAIDEVNAGERPHLVAQMREFVDAGVHVTAFLAAVPSITAIIDAAQAGRTDGIMIPEELDHPRLMDRLQSDHSHIGHLVEHVASLKFDERPTIFVVPPDGSIAVLQPATDQFG